MLQRFIPLHILSITFNIKRMIFTKKKKRKIEKEKMRDKKLEAKREHKREKVGESSKKDNNLIKIFCIDGLFEYAKAI